LEAGIVFLKIGKSFADTGPTSSANWAGSGLLASPRFGLGVNTWPKMTYAGSGPKDSRRGLLHGPIGPHRSDVSDGLKQNVALCCLDRWWPSA
jgi:hypothetical protein